METKIAIAVTVGLGVWILSGYLTIWAQHRVRASELEDNETVPLPARRVLGWHHVHVRDDVAGLLTIGPFFTNGLLAAILATLITG